MRYVASNDTLLRLQPVGVGGPLIMTYYGSATTNAFVAYDGNGNVAALIDAANGNVCARYEYGVFAEPIRASGPMAALNPIRYSTKYTGTESGLLYYGYRYYNPSTGRWISRDPLFENARANMFGFGHNEAVNKVDVLGLREITVSKRVVWWNVWWDLSIQYVLMAGWSRNSLEAKLTVRTDDGCTAQDARAVYRAVTSRWLWNPTLILEQGPTFYSKSSSTCPCGVTCYRYVIGFKWTQTLCVIRIPQVGHNIPVLSSFQQTVIELTACADGTVSATAANSQSIPQLFPWTENTFEPR